MENRFSVLDVEDVEASDTSEDVAVKGDLENYQFTGKNSNSTKSTSDGKKGRNRETKTNTIIVGHSMIKYVKGWEMSSTENRVSVQSFSGATIEDMSDFIKPILRKKPETVTLHIGTNNLREGDGKSVADGIINLAQSIRRQCPDIEIIVSRIITRSDNVSASSKVREPKLVKTMCN